MTYSKRKPVKIKGVAQHPERATLCARSRRRRSPRTVANRSEDFSVLARTKFDGLHVQTGQTPLRIALERPPVLKNVDLSWFYATVEHLMSYDDEQFCAVDPENKGVEAILELGTTCVHVAEWHRDIAKIYDALVARIAVRAARKVEEAGHACFQEG